MQNDRLHVLMLAPRVFEEPYLGGGERYVSALCKALYERGDLRLTLVTATGPTHIELRMPSAEPKRLRIRELVTLGRTANIIHVHQINSPAFDIATALTTLVRRPLILTDHGGGWKTPGRVIGRQRLRLVSGLAPVSATSAKDLRWGATKPMQILYGGGDHLPRYASKSQLRITDFLYVGRLLPHKGIDLLINSLPSGRSLRICGSIGDPAFIRHLQGLAAEKDVDFILSPPDSELASIYSASSFTILPSLDRLDQKVVRRPELLGLVLLESIACGTPCSGSSLPAIREVLEPAGMPVFPVGSETALNATLMSLPHRSDYEHQRYRELCVVAANRYSWKETATRATNFYRKLIEPGIGV